MSPFRVGVLSAGEGAPVKEAMFYDSATGGTVVCHLCPHRCRIKEGKRGACGVRENRGGHLSTLVHSKVVAANIDGRVGDEIIYPAGSTLVAVTGDRSSGSVLWTWTAPAQLSVPAIVDVDGDGLAEIVVQDASATIHCLDGVQ